MTDPHSNRLLSIGEFAAATQLSPKALRLYDAQGILRPATVDATSGYRYYRNDQVTLGRLIRVLRDMDLPLAAVADVVAASATQAETLLRQFAQDSDRRYAFQKRAFEAALASLRRSAAAEAPMISQRERAATTVAVRPFLADRHELLARFRAEAGAAYAALAASGVAVHGEPFCILVDPLSDDEGRIEVALAMHVPGAMPAGVTIRQLPARPCAVLEAPGLDTQAPDLAAVLDALFDWFDRLGYRAAEAPCVTFLSSPTAVRAEVAWAYESAPPAIS